MFKRIPISYLYISPFFIAYIVLQIYPLSYSFYLSFTKYDGFDAPTYIGISNFSRLLQDTLFWQSVSNTLRNWGIAFTLQLVSAIVLSAIFTYSKLKYMNFFRGLFYFPNFVTAATIALIFAIIFNQEHGVFNEFLMNFNIISEPINWLRKEVVIITTTPIIVWWLWFGQTTIILCAGLTSISKDYYDAALIDGATPVQSYWHITLPLVRPTILYILITSLIGGMQHYDIAALLTSGGEGNPNYVNQTMVMYMYNQAFKYGHFGYGATISIGIFIIIQIGAGIMLYWYNTRKQKI